MVGLFPGKFLPPHRGHLNAIIQAATQVDKLYVVVSGNNDYMLQVCSEQSLKPMPLNLRARWLAKELAGFNHIKIITIDETGIPAYPRGIPKWSMMVKKTIPERFDVIFGGEPEYAGTYMKYFEGVDYKLFDPIRSAYPVSATKVRNNPMQYWDYILGAARPHFAKRVLITGTESVGKTTLTKYLAKMYHTSWAEEYGRYHSELHFGAQENLYEEQDFTEIIRYQRDWDDEALKSSNKVVFFDTDAVVTQYYRDLYLGVQGEDFTSHPENYDLTLIMGPEVRWVDDGMRFKSDQDERERLHKKLCDLYSRHAFKNVQEIHSKTYQQRLCEVKFYVDRLIGA